MRDCIKSGEEQPCRANEGSYEHVNQPSNTMKQTNKIRSLIFLDFESTLTPRTTRAHIGAFLISGQWYCLVLLDGIFCLAWGGYAPRRLGQMFFSHQKNENVVWYFYYKKQVGEKKTHKMLKKDGLFVYRTEIDDDVNVNVWWFGDQKAAIQRGTKVVVH